MCAVIEPVRAQVNFGPLNLLDPFRHLGSFDVIFCRNVMIYFDQQTRDQLVENLSGQLAPGGHPLYRALRDAAHAGAKTSIRGAGHIQENLMSPGASEGVVVVGTGDCRIARPKTGGRLQQPILAHAGVNPLKKNLG